MGFFLGEWAFWGGLLGSSVVEYIIELKPARSRNGELGSGN